MTSLTEFATKYEESLLILAFSLVYFYSMAFTMYISGFMSSVSKGRGESKASVPYWGYIVFAFTPVLNIITGAIGLGLLLVTSCKFVEMGAAAEKNRENEKNG